MDINACNTEYAASVMVYGRKLFYSYKACGSADEFSVGLKRGRSRCAAGMQPNEADADKCEVCPAGTAKAAVGNKACVSCAPGRFAKGSALECSPCAEGTFVAIAGASQCARCPAALSSAEGASECSLCAAGYFDAGLGAGRRDRIRRFFPARGAHRDTLDFHFRKAATEIVRTYEIWYKAAEQCY